ncbi:MAG TPA: twin-arginine translocation signal domain-containing protein [Gammaproteobacteria bacterium]|nr:twin-arginine translocation signal domain-containing protein [Gammaproteobacteria bacterium]
MNVIKSAVSRRKFLGFAGAAFAVGALGGVSGSLYWASNNTAFLAYVKGRQNAVLGKIARDVLPLQGRTIEVSFGDSITRLVEAGVISPEKFKAIYVKRGGLPGWVEELFTKASSTPITLSFQTAPYLLNLLWPLGVATKTQFNDKSPLNGPNVGRYASTGGWVIGQAPRGGEYFNKVAALDLDSAQEAVALEAAQNTYRPCCNNSTFFQDCNHGSALLGLYELAAAQGKKVEELYQIGRIANSYWYPDAYVEMAYYFKNLTDLTWSGVQPKTVLGATYSSFSGWQKNVHKPLIKAGLVPSAQSGNSSSCAV